MGYLSVLSYLFNCHPHFDKFNLILNITEYVFILDQYYVRMDFLHADQFQACQVMPFTICRVSLFTKNALQISYVG